MAMKPKVSFLCTGNSARSAERLEVFRKVRDEIIENIEREFGEDATSRKRA
jgi:protein-tyrosine-phosphatase